MSDLNLYDILLEIKTRLTSIEHILTPQRNTSDMSEITPAENGVTEKKSDLKEVIRKRIHAYYNSYEMPLSLTLLMRIYNKRIKHTGKNLDVLIRDMPDILTIITSRSSFRFVPKIAWEKADETTREMWTNDSDKELLNFIRNNLRLSAKVLGQNGEDSGRIYNTAIKQLTPRFDGRKDDT